MLVSLDSANPRLRSLALTRSVTFCNTGCCTKLQLHSTKRIFRKLKTLSQYIELNPLIIVICLFWVLNPNVFIFSGSWIPILRPCGCTEHLQESSVALALMSLVNPCEILHKASQYAALVAAYRVRLRLQIWSANQEPPTVCSTAAWARACLCSRPRCGGWWWCSRPRCK